MSANSTVCGRAVCGHGTGMAKLDVAVSTMLLEGMFGHLFCPRL